MQLQALVLLDACCSSHGSSNMCSTVLLQQPRICRCSTIRLHHMQAPSTKALLHYTANRQARCSACCRYQPLGHFSCMRVAEGSTPSHHPYRHCKGQGRSAGQSGCHPTSKPSIFLTRLLPSSSRVRAVNAANPSTAATLLAAQYSSRRGGVAAGSLERLVKGARLRI